MFLVFKVIYHLTNNYSIYYFYLFLQKFNVFI